MFLLRLLNAVCAVWHSILSTCYQVFSLQCNDFGHNYSHIVSPVDKIPIPIWSLLSSDICNDKTDFLKYCRKEYFNNRFTLSKIDEFELNYCSDDAIYWYTRDTFVHRIVTKILSSGNVELIKICQFFIRDLHEKLACLHRMKYQRDLVQPAQIYLSGKTLLTKDLNEFIPGKLITFNSFLSTSSSRDVAMMFAGNVLLEIEVDNRKGLYEVFHSISNLSNFKDEEEILFSIGNVFQVEKIDLCKKDLLWKIKLTLQKHIQYRANLQLQSTNSMKQKLIERIWEDFD